MSTRNRHISLKYYRNQVVKDPPPARTVPAAHFCGTLAVNVDNDKLSDAEFRQFVRNTLPIVIYDSQRKSS